MYRKAHIRKGNAANADVYKRQAPFIGHKQDKIRNFANRLVIV